jgi:pimeloyl-ACP methyl ester carboxylesterase
VPEPVRAALLAAAAALVLALAAPAGAATRLGTVTLHRCADDHAFRCGSITRALDRAKPGAKRIRIALRWRPATSGHADGPPLLAVEGGPGYPSIGSSFEYTGIYGPLLRTRDLLLVDNRGTGGSNLIHCPSVQRYTGPSWDAAFAGRVAACARRIDRSVGVKGAANRFGTADAADDLDAVLRRLRLPKVDLYGDSYGTWFTQAFAARHPDRLHSVVLDSAYPVVGLDPFYTSSGPTARDALNAVCARDPGCAAAGGSAVGRLAALVERLRTGPALRGHARTVSGVRVRARVDVRTLVDLVQDAGSDPVVYRDLDPAVRAALAGDAQPLLRLAAQSGEWDHGSSTASYFSDGLYFAVSCVDYPQLFSMHHPPALRPAQLAASIARGPHDAFAPFSLDEWMRMSAYSEPYRACLRWPRVTDVRPPVPPGWKPLPASVPLLVVGGDLDSLTPLRDARELAPRIAAHSRVVRLRNTVHVTSEGDTFLTDGARCGRQIIRAFVRAPGRLDAIDASCAARIPHLHTAGAFPRTLAAARPAALLSGMPPGGSVRRAATVAAGALADATIRRYYGGTTRGPGLRGGHYTARGDALVRLALHDVRFTRDTTVSGTARWRPGDGRVRGSLQVRLPGGRAVAVTLAWSQRSRFASVRAAGATLATPAP